MSIKGPKFLWAFSKEQLSRNFQKFCLHEQLHAFSYTNINLPFYMTFVDKTGTTKLDMVLQLHTKT